MNLLLMGPDWKSVAGLRGELVRDMLAAGWTVTIGAGGARDAAFSALSAAGASCVALPLSRTSISPLGDLKLLVTVYGLCRRLKPDVVVAVTVKPVTIGLIAAWLAEVPVRTGMITGLGYAFTEGPGLKRRLVRTAVSLLYRMSLGRASRVFFQNDDDIADFRKLRLLSERTPVTRTNGSGVDLVRFSAVPLPSGPLVFVMVARLLIDKGVREFADAARRSLWKHPELKFRLVGAFDSNPAAIQRNEIESLVAEGVIEYLGELSDVRPALRNAHIFVLPSYREGTPRAALEALAMGRPVLTTDVPGCREVVIDGVTGRLVKARSPDAIVEAIEWFVQCKEELELMAVAARKDCEFRFDVHSVNRIVMNQLKSDLAGCERLTGDSFAA